MKHNFYFILKCVRRISLLSIWFILLGAFIFPPSVQAGVQLQKLYHMEHIKGNLLEEHLTRLPDRKYYSEDDLFEIKEVVRKEKWRCMEASKEITVKNWHPISVWYTYFYAVVPINAVWGEYVFWNEEKFNKKDISARCLAYPISPTIYSLFDDINPFDALLVIPAWVIGIHRIKTQRIETTEKVKVDNYDEIKQSIENYEAELARRNQQINKENERIQKELDQFNAEIDRHNRQVQHQYKNITDSRKTASGNRDAIIKNYNRRIDKANQLIAQGKMPDRFPSLSVAPPQIILSFQSLEETGRYANANGVLEAGESADLIFKIKNVGKGDGYGVLLKTQVDGRNLKVAPTEIGMLPAGTKKQVRVNVTAPFTAEDDKIKLTILPKESLGNDGTPISLNIKIKSIPKPTLEIGNVLVKDSSAGLASGNGNGIAENGETVELHVSVLNSGQGDALGVSFDSDIDDNALSLKSSRGQIGTIPAHGSGVAKIAINIPKKYDAKKIPVSFTVKEERDLSDAQKIFTIPYHLRKPNLIVTVTPFDGTYASAPGYRNGKIEKGEQIELAIKVENTGDGIAEGVKINLSANQTGVIVVNNTADIGTIPARQSGEAKLMVNVQRGFKGEALTIEAAISHLDAENISRSFNYTVHETAMASVDIGEERARKSANIPPKIFIYAPKNNSTTTEENIRVSGFVGDDEAVKEIIVTVNGKKIHDTRGIGITPKLSKSKEIDINLPLVLGENTITFIAVDSSGVRSSEEALKVTRLAPEKGEIHVVCIGINNYRYVDPLKYSVNDATAFSEYAIDHLNVPKQNVILITDEDATQKAIKRILGDDLRRKADRKDTVIIFFAGHGAPYPDKTSQDPDQIEKYLLPVDAERDSLYSSAIQMDDIADILSRLQAERVVFIADTCYSGASGGRTLLANRGFRAQMSDHFLERLATGKGRVILAACEPGELAREDDDKQHGLFTYYLLEGLKGPADMDHDGSITTDEIYSYLDRNIPRASDQSQHPVKKGEGIVTIGVVR